MNQDSSGGQTFADTMRTQRLAAGLTQRTLSQNLIQLGVSIDQATIARMESGQREPRLSEAVAIAEYLQFDLLQIAFDLPNVSYHGALQNGTQKYFAARAAIDAYLRSAADAARQYKLWELREPASAEDGDFLEHALSLPGTEQVHNAEAVDWKGLDWDWCEPYIRALLAGLAPKNPA
ncbi:helix-turn-helix domain-containing protein [Williamsia sp. MIQD14]|uniref:helix-turn-helix domain-containing protein n=1 Tax=Williamsia sp. MIQD14 TaxID=3425703 RepID=UPI003DA17B69